MGESRDPGLNRTDAHRTCRSRLASFLLSVVCCPLKLPRISLVDKKALPASCRAEVKYCAVVSDVHHSRGGRERLAAEGALVRPRQSATLPDLFRFAFGLSQCENVADSNGPLYVSRDDSTLVSPLKQPDSYLDHFTCDAGPAYDLRHLGRC